MKLRFIPNIITCLRLLLIGPFLFFLSSGNYVLAMSIFLLAAISDGVDGLLARHFHWQSKFGSFADPMADKLLITAAFVMLALLEKIPFWIMFLVMLRDLVIIAGVFTWYKRFGQIEFTPTFLSKINTGLQLAYIIGILYTIALHPIAPFLLTLSLALTASTTLLSLLDYVWSWGKKAIQKTPTTLR